MMSPAMIQAILVGSPWPENQISQAILLPCLDQFSVRSGLRLRNLKFTGGASELGNDIEYYELFGPDQLRFYTGIQVKKGTIGLGESTSLVTQGIQAFDKDIVDASNGQVYRINRWIVIATGDITAPARAHVVQQLNRYAKPIHFWDGLKISELISEYYYREFVQAMGVNQYLAASENVRMSLWDPDKPLVVAEKFSSTSFVSMSVAQAAPPTASGIYLTVRPNDANMPSVTCIVRSSIHEITIDSLQSQLQAYVLRINGGADKVEAMILEVGRSVDILARGYIDIL